MTSEPRMRITPGARAQLDAANGASSTLYGLPVRTTSGLIDDEVMLMAQRVAEAEARAWAAGMELGPYEFETVEQGPNAWTVRVTAEFRPRGQA